MPAARGTSASAATPAATRCWYNCTSPPLGGDPKNSDLLQVIRSTVGNFEKGNVLEYIAFTSHPVNAWATMIGEQAPVSEGGCVIVIDLEENRSTCEFDETGHPVWPKKFQG